ncbi:MAG: DUF4926 domain-containing protein [Bacteroidetes bacterium]|nr:DUF4926 domain-containing protein [Bacteroidota bacterium]
MKATIKEFDRVILTENIEKPGLKVGDIGTVVHVYDKGKGFEVEFATLLGETVAVCTLFPNQIRAIDKREIAHVRKLAAA